MPLIYPVSYTHLDVYKRQVKEYPLRNKYGRTTISGFCESRNHEIIISVWNGRVYHLDKEKAEFVPYPDKMRRQNPTVMVQDNEQDYFWLEMCIRDSHYPCRVEAHHRQMAFKGNGQYDDSQQSRAARFPRCV